MEVSCHILMCPASKHSKQTSAFYKSWVKVRQVGKWGVCVVPGVSHSCTLHQAHKWTATFHFSDGFLSYGTQCVAYYHCIPVQSSCGISDFRGMPRVRFCISRAHVLSSQHAISSWCTLDDGKSCAHNKHTLRRQQHPRHVATRKIQAEGKWTATSLKVLIYYLQDA